MIKKRKLRNVQRHMRGAKVLCSGNVYEIDEEGFTEVTPEDAEKMLQGAAWKPVSHRAPRAPQVAPEPEETKPEVPQVAPENDGELKSDEEPEGDEETKPEVSDEEPSEFPDPTMDMSKTELRKIAAAYRIEYKPQTTKKELVDLITAAMYPADEAE